MADPPCCCGARSRRSSRGDRRSCLASCWCRPVRRWRRGSPGGSCGQRDGEGVEFVQEVVRALGRSEVGGAQYNVAQAVLGDELGHEGGVVEAERQGGGTAEVALGRGLAEKSGPRAPRVPCLVEGPDGVLPGPLARPDRVEREVAAGQDVAVQGLDVLDAGLAEL